MSPKTTRELPWSVHNSGAPHRVIATKELPGTRWLSVLADADCEVHVCGSKEILEVDEIRAAIGERCDGAIGQLTERWGDALFEALASAGGAAASKAYSNYAVGYNNVVVDEATRRGIPVGNTPGVLTETTAEMAVALLFAAARRVTEAEAYLRDGRFHGWLPDLFLGKRLWGGTLGIVGAGRIGARFALMVAPGHDMDVIYQDVERSAELEGQFEAINRMRAELGERELACEYVREVDELLARADVVSLHVPLTEETRHLMNARRLGLMKRDAILINTSRGPVIDEKALVEHLRSSPDFHAGLDVFEEEPALAPGLSERSNAVIVPHIASATAWTREGMATLAAANVAAILRGDPVARELHVEEFLEGETIARKAPSIVNADALGLPRA